MSSPSDCSDSALPVLHGRKPRVVSLGRPLYAGDEYLAEFSKEYDFSVLDAPNHVEALAKLPASIQDDGPIDALVITRVGGGGTSTTTPPFDYAPPFDYVQAMLGGLAQTSPKCTIVTSAGAGYDEVPVEWLARQGIWFTHTVRGDATVEAKSDPVVRVQHSPHLPGGGVVTDRACQRAERQCFENIRAVFATGRPNSPVIDIHLDGVSR